MSLTGDMPLVGGKRFGIRPESDKAIRIDMGRVMDMVRDYPFPTLKVQGDYVVGAAKVYPEWARKLPSVVARPVPQAPIYGTLSALSATNKPMYVGDYVRGSDKSKNYRVDKDFRGTILEFITPTPEGNNVRVKCSNTGRVYRVKNNEIRGAK